MSFFRRMAILFPLAGACASLKTSAPESPTAVIVAPQFGAVTNSYAAIATPVSLAPDSVYQLVRRVYATLEIPVAQESEATRLIGNDALKARRKIAGMEMRKVLECGENIGVPNADNYDIEMSLLTSVLPDGKGGANVSTRIQAMAHDPSLSNIHWMACSTSSALEDKIGQTVAKLAAANARP